MMPLQNKYESVLKHMSPLHHHNMTDWTYKWLCNVRYKYYFSSAAIDEIYLENHDDCMIFRKVIDVFRVWT
jgi:hypothetical protein